VAKDSAGATLSTLQVKSASLSEIPVTRDAQGRIAAPGGTPNGSELGVASLDVLWSIPGAEFEGRLAAGSPVWDQSGVRYLPTRVSLQGRLANIEAGVKTDYLQGKASVSVAGFDQYSALSPTSASNFYTVNATFSGNVTAPQRPLLAVTLGTSWKACEDAPKTATLEYRSFSGGSPRAAISVAANVDASGVATFTLTETMKGISVTAREDATSADVMSGGTTKIGVLDANSGVLTFTDNSFVSAF